MNINVPHPLENEIKAFEREKDNLEKTYPSKFVVYKDGAFVGAWDNLQAAAAEAIVRFGRGPYLIRQVGSPAPTLPASVLFRSTELV